jgi:signal transduction histidine kinase
VAHDFQADIDAISRMDVVPLILDVVCRTTGMGFAAVARVTETRWIACQVLDQIQFGLQPGGELKVETTICNEIRTSRDAVAIDNVAEDDIYCGHPTPLQYGFQSYISMPIIQADGRFFGTLCAIDPRPARLKNPETIGMFKLFAALIASHLDSSDQLALAQAELAQEHSLAELREQFVAVLGHDLRNPIAAIDSGTKLLRRIAVDEKSRQILTLMEGSVGRMKGLIDNVLDFTRSRLGGGLALNIDADKPLQPVLEHVVAELRAILPDRTIETDFAVAEPVVGDHLRLARMFSNLLGNALTHGAEDAPVRAGGSTSNGMLELWVSNTGAPIPAEIIGQLFLPYFRSKGERNREGLGLGLYIASQIAKLHGGSLAVSSSPEETRFTFRMPLKPA